MFANYRDALYYYLLIYDYEHGDYNFHKKIMVPKNVN